MIRWRSPAWLGLALLASCAHPVPRGPVAAPPRAPAPPVRPSEAPPAPPPARAPVDPQVRADLRKAAADRTLAAKALLVDGLRADGARERHDLLLRALNEYGLATRAWTRLFTLDPDDPEVSETRYWIADAWHAIVVIEEGVDGTPSPEERDAARRAAVAARATTRGTLREAAASMVVDLADRSLKAQHRLHERTHGAQGFAERTQLRTTGEGEATRVVEDPLPFEVKEAIAARDAYLDRVPPADDPGGKRALLAYEAANFHFLYGQLAEARRRLVPLYLPTACGPDEMGYRAWSRLLDIANLQMDIAAARALAEDRMKTSCHPAAPGPPHPPLQPPYPYIDAYHFFVKAEKMPPGPERDKVWRDAAETYGAALRNAPEYDEAPESAINGAYAYKQIGAYAEARELLRLFLRTYGSEVSLDRLARGDTRATPPRPPDPRRYAEHRKYAQLAAQNAAAGEVMSFDYEAAAEIYEATAGNRHFDRQGRRDAAQNALILRATLGERERVQAAWATFSHLDPPLEKLAEVTWLVVRTSLDAWDERAPDTGPNRAARLAALVEVERFAARYESRPEAAPMFVHAAHAAAQLHRAGGSPAAAAWCARAVSASARAAASPSFRRSFAGDLAASCALSAIDAPLHARFGAPPAPRRYRGDAPAIERAFLADLAVVEAHARRAEELDRSFGPGPWLVAARAAEATALDACQAGLAPLATGDGLRAAWRRGVEKAARAFVEVVFLAGALRVAPPAVDHARRRLAALARLLGEPAMRALSAGIAHPREGASFAYREGMFSSPPGLHAWSDDLLAPPLPVVE